MPRKKILEKRMQRLLAKKATLDARCKASTDVEEVRSLTADLEEVNAEIAETQEEIDVISAEAEETRSAVPQSAELKNGAIVQSFQVPQQDQSDGTVVDRRSQRNQAEEQHDLTGVQQRDNCQLQICGYPIMVTKNRHSGISSVFRQP